MAPSEFEGISKYRMKKNNGKFSCHQRTNKRPFISNNEILSEELILIQELRKSSLVNGENMAIFPDEIGFVFEIPTTPKRITLDKFQNFASGQVLVTFADEPRKSYFQQNDIYVFNRDVLKKHKRLLELPPLKKDSCITIFDTTLNNLIRKQLLDKLNDLKQIDFKLGNGHFKAIVANIVCSAYIVVIHESVIRSCSNNGRHFRNSIPVAHHKISDVLMSIYSFQIPRCDQYKIDNIHTLNWDSILGEQNKTVFCSKIGSEKEAYFARVRVVAKKVENGKIRR